VVALALALASFALAAPASQAHDGHGSHHGDDAASAAAVRAWNQIAVNTLIALPGPSGGAPPAAAVHIAMVKGAVYDAVNAISYKHYRPYLLKKRFAPWASEDAAVAAAAYKVLKNILSTVPDFPPNTVPTREARLATPALPALDPTPWVGDVEPFVV
jgi:hypothetical protein